MMSMSRDIDVTLVLKGEKDGLVVVVPESARASGIPAALERFVEEKKEFLQNTCVTVDIGQRKMTSDDLLFFAGMFMKVPGLRVRAWRSASKETACMLESAGFRVVEENGAGESVSGQPGREAEPTLLVLESMRSGRRIEHAGDVVVTGNVNGGAELIAEGNVVVWGDVTGLVHAGCSGRDGVFVLAGSFGAPQIRIGSRISCARERAGWGAAPVLLRIDGETLTARELSDPCFKKRSFEQ